MFELWDMCWIHIRCEGSQAFDERRSASSSLTLWVLIFETSWTNCSKIRSVTPNLKGEEMTVIGSCKAPQIKFLTATFRWNPRKTKIMIPIFSTDNKWEQSINDSDESHGAFRRKHIEHGISHVSLRSERSFYNDVSFRFTIAFTRDSFGNKVVSWQSNKSSCVASMNFDEITLFPVIYREYHTSWVHMKGSLKKVFLRFHESNKYHFIPFMLHSRILFPLLGSCKLHLWSFWLRKSSRTFSVRDYF